MIEVVRCPEISWNGLTFAEIARQKNQQPVDLFIDALQKYDTDLRWMSTGANDRLNPRLALMQHPYILAGFTDAGAHVRNLGYYDGALSLLKQAVTTKFLTPEAAISRVTGEPAQWFCLNTGILKVGAKADIVLIKPDSLYQPISPQVEIPDPILDGELRMVKRGSEEIVQAVYINGVLVVSGGKVKDILGKTKLGTVLFPSSV
jgi:N-acyl-D-aspartate/D-glutamate deacylase